MLLKKNIFANYASQLYVAVIGVVMVPIYLKYMGIAAYGLVGFFAMAQAWFQLLDFGLSPTFGREAAKYNAGATSANVLRMLLRLLEIIFGAVGITIIAASWLAGPWVANSWLKLENIDSEEVATSIVIVCIALSLRLISGIYRGGLLGFQHQVTTSIVTVVMATLRAVMVVPVLIWVSNSILMFFSFQLVVALVEVVLLRAMLLRLLPSGKVEKFAWDLLKEPLKFGGGLAFLTWAWVVSSQADKLILSHMLPMHEYGEFILATTIALGAMLCVSPLQQAVLPRLIMLAEQNARSDLVDLYVKTTILMAALLSGVAGVMVAFPAQVLYVWTGNIQITTQAADVLRWYAAGTGFMGLAGMNYTLQHAYGDLRLHIKGSIVSLVVLIPAVIISTLYYGAVGAAAAWAAINLLFLFCWTPVVHNRFLPEIRTSWLFRDVAPSLIFSALLCLVAQKISWPLASRLVMLLNLGGLVLGLIAASLYVHQETRQMIQTYLRKLAE